MTHAHAFLTVRQCKDLFYRFIIALRTSRWRDHGHIDVRGRMIQLQHDCILVVWRPRCSPWGKDDLLNQFKSMTTLPNREPGSVTSYYWIEVLHPLSCEPGQELAILDLDVARRVAPFEVREYPLSSLYAMEQPTSPFARWLSDEPIACPCEVCGTSLMDPHVQYDANRPSGLRASLSIYGPVCPECGHQPEPELLIPPGFLRRRRLFAARETRDRAGDFGHPAGVTTKDPINPDYYKDPVSGIEAVEIAEELGFNVGNAFTYLFRAGKKGPAGEDLRKAAWHLRREGARLAKGGEPVRSTPRARTRAWTLMCSRTKLPAVALDDLLGVLTLFTTPTPGALESLAARCEEAANEAEGRMTVPDGGAK